MKRRIKHNDLTAWFLQDHATLPASYVKSCQEFFKWLDESNKEGFKAPSLKPEASSRKQRGLTKKEERLGWITRGHEPQAASDKPEASSIEPRPDDTETSN
jgi:hypothetical protein